MQTAPLPVVCDRGDREVSNEESYVIATAKDYGGFSVLSVYKSIRCRDVNSWMKPVVAETAGRCVQWKSSLKLDDESMVGGAAWFSEYIVYDRCPGTGVIHECEDRDDRREIGFPAQRVRP